jgi:hypothetical protein
MSHRPSAFEAIDELQTNVADVFVVVVGLVEVSENSVNLLKLVVRDVATVDQWPKQRIDEVLLLRVCAA